MSGRDLRPLIFVVILFLPSCLHINIDREFNYLTRLGYERTGKDVELKSTDKLLWDKKSAELAIYEGISREDAVRIALQNNPGLQAAFQDIGIAKAELVQAGLLTNPDYDYAGTPQILDELPSFFNLTNLVLFYVDDFWKKPFETRVARDQLDIIFSELEKEILETKAETERAYNAVLFAMEKLAAAKEIVRDSTEFYEVMKEHNEKGECEDVDLRTAETILGGETTRLIEARAELRVAFVRLREVMGVKVNSSSFPLKETLYDPLPQLASLDDLIAEAEGNHPDIHRALARLERTRHAVSLERARIIGEVRLGFVVEKELGLNILGPAFTIEVPIFDLNQAQIARAEFEYHKAEKEFLDIRRGVIRDVIVAFDDLKAFLDIVETYKNLIKPSYVEGTKCILKLVHEGTMDDTTKLVTFLVALDRFFEIRIDHYEALQSALNGYVELELAVGRKLTFLHSKEEPVVHF